MALDDDIRILSGVRLFEGLTQEQLRLLAFGAETMQLPPDRKLYREDDEADSAYVVLGGRIVLYREHRRRAGRCRTVGPGAMLGELALIADTSRLTSAVAAGEAEVLRLSRSMFRRILEEYPETAQALHARITEELQAMIRRIEKLGPRFRVLTVSATCLNPAANLTGRGRSVAITGTWSDGRSQPRASRRISMPAGSCTRFCDDQTWSSRRPRSAASQSRAR